MTGSTVDLALTTSQAKTLGIGVIVAILVIGALISLIITAIVGRLIVVVIVVVAGLYVWNQRGNIQSAAQRCDASFFGVHLTPSDPDLKAKCQSITSP